ncbi:MAG: hypothetical protein ABL897_10615 [Hyphomicrobium sp.]
MKALKPVLLPLALVLLTGCSHDSIVVTAEPLCGSITTVCISKADKLSEGTATQIEANNLARTAICKPKGDQCAGVRVKPSKVEPPKQPPVASAKPLPKAPAVLPFDPPAPRRAKMQELAEAGGS